MDRGYAFARHPLDDIAEKLAWAEQQLDLLNTDVTKWMREHKPYGVEIKRYPRQGRILMLFCQTDPYPAWISIRAGEVIHQARSSLDHLVAYAVEHAGGTVSTNHGFPIKQTESKWRSDVERRRKWWQLWRKKGGGPLKGIDPHGEVWAAIKGAQPYHCGKQAAGHPLQILQDMWNWDKHRSLHPISIVLPDPNQALNMLGFNPPIEPIARKALFKPDRPVEHGTKLARFDFPTDGPLPEVSVEGEITQGIGVGDPKRSGSTVADVLERVKRVVEEIDPLLR